MAPKVMITPSFLGKMSEEACVALASLQMDDKTAIGTGGAPWYKVGSSSAVNFCLNENNRQRVFFLFGFTETFSS
jgi:hypothetical protein